MSEKISAVIVEDHAVTRRGLASALTEGGFIEVLGSSGLAADGLELCRRVQPDIVLLDLHLPDSDDVEELVKGFAAVVQHVVIFSAEGRRAFVEVAKNLPIAGYLLKSESTEVITEALRKVMDGVRPVMSKSLMDCELALTAAEKELLRLLAQGYKYENIARLRNTSPATVKKQCERLLVKLELVTREELISWAALHGYGNLQP